jgi:hypothetical protein
VELLETPARPSDISTRGRYFVVKKTLLSVIALAVALAFMPVLPSMAASPMGPGTRVASDSVVEAAADKKKAKKPAKKAKKAKKGKKGKKKAKKASKAGSCGAYMYFSKKAKKCVDARR